MPAYICDVDEHQKRVLGKQDKVERLLMRVFGEKVVNKMRSLDPVLGQVMHMVVNGVNVFFAAVISGMKEHKIPHITSKVAAKTIVRKINGIRQTLKSRLEGEKELSTIEKENIGIDLEATKRLAISRFGNRDCTYTYPVFEQAYNAAISELETQRSIQ